MRKHVALYLAGVPGYGCVLLLEYGSALRDLRLVRALGLQLEHHQIAAALAAWFPLLGALAAVIASALALRLARAEPETGADPFLEMYLWLSFICGLPVCVGVAAVMALFYFGTPRW